MQHSDDKPIRAIPRSRPVAGAEPVGRSTQRVGDRGVSEQNAFDNLCRALATPMERRAALKAAGTAILAVVAATIPVPALAHFKRHGCVVGKEAVRRVRETPVCDPELELNCFPGSGALHYCCKKGLGETCCTVDCCPRGFSKCCLKPDVRTEYCCPDDGDCCGFTDGGKVNCCSSGYRVCNDGGKMCCHKETVCLEDQAPVAGKSPWGCCPKQAGGGEVLCGLVCCPPGHICDFYTKGAFTTATKRCVDQTGGKQ